MNVPKTMTLYSAEVCPFVHRTRLVLAEKGLEHELVEIDTENKPEWFLELSPNGKVPLLKHGQAMLYESLVINEYLEDCFPAPALRPTEPLLCAQMRLWIDFCATKFVPAWAALMKAENEEQQRLHSEQLQNHLLFMEAEATAHFDEGQPYWCGAELSLADVAFFPFFERMPVLEYYYKFQIPQACARLKRWWKVMEERPSVQTLALSAQFYIDRCARFVRTEVLAALSF